MRRSERKRNLSARAAEAVQEGETEVRFLKKKPKPAPAVDRLENAKSDAEVEADVEAEADAEADVKEADSERVGSLVRQLYKPARRKYPTRKVIVNERDETWGADLADMSKYVEDNDGYRYILTVIDIFTRHAWAVALRTKNGPDLVRAFKKIFATGRKPRKLWVDQGGEFVNRDLAKLRAEHKIEMYHTFGKGKSAIVERFNRTLKTIMWKHLAALDSRQWYPILDTLVRQYNETPHGSLRVELTPVEASQDALAPAVRRAWVNRIARHEEKHSSKPTFAVGDQVRVSRLKGKFEKGYEQNWSTEIYRVKEVLETAPVTYILQDSDGDRVRGSFYEQELQRVSGHTVLRTVGDKALVRFEGIAEPSWVPRKLIDGESPS